MNGWATMATESGRFAELSGEVDYVVAKPATKSCFQSVEDIDKLGGYGLKEIHI